MSSCTNWAIHADPMKLNPSSKSRIVTEDNKAEIRKAFRYEDGNSYMWVQSMGNIIPAVSFAKAWTSIKQDYIKRYFLSDNKI